MARTAVKNAVSGAVQGASRAKRPEWSEAEKLEAFEAVLDAMAEGKTLDQAVKGLERPCSAGAMRKWIAESEAWMGRYQRAKKLLAQALAEEAIQIARDSTSYSTATDRVLIDTLKWAAAKANPGEYGERQTVEHQGAQTLSVRVVEESPVVKNPAAAGQIGDAVASAMSQIASQPMMVALPSVMLGAEKSQTNPLMDS